MKKYILISLLFFFVALQSLMTSNTIDISQYFLPQLDKVYVYIDTISKKHEYIYDKASTEDNVKYWYAVIYTDDFKLSVFSKKRIDKNKNVLLELVHFPSEPYQGYALAGVKIIDNIVINLIPAIGSVYQSSYEATINKDNKFYLKNMYTTKIKVIGFQKYNNGEKEITALKLTIESIMTRITQDNKKKEIRTINDYFYEQNKGEIRRIVYSPDKKIIGDFVLEKIITFDEFKKMGSAITDIIQ